MFEPLVIGIGVLLLFVWTIEVVFPKQKGSILPEWLFPKPKKKKKTPAQELGEVIAKLLDK